MRGDRSKRAAGRAERTRNRTGSRVGGTLTQRRHSCEKGVEEKVGELHGDCGEADLDWVEVGLCEGGGRV